MTYQADDQSISSSRPRELFTFETPSSVAYLTSFNRDIVAERWDDPLTDVTYVATPGLGRTSLPVVNVGGTSEVVVDLPHEHEVAQMVLGSTFYIRRYMQVTVLRQQEISGEIIRAWQGYVVSANVEGRKCNIRIPNLFMEALDTDVPTALVMRNCNHVLYDTNCRVDRASFDHSTTGSSGSADNEIVVASLGSGTADWYKWGEIEHPTSTERRTIVKQVGTTLTLDAPFPFAIWAMDANFNVYAGCDHTMSGTHGCQPKFANRRRFGGFPQLPVVNPYVTSLNGMGNFF